MYFWGGGHKGYGGNELYVLDLFTMRWRLIAKATALSPPPADWKETKRGCQGYERGADGRQTAPSSAHTYDGIIYVPKDESIYVWGAAVFCWSGWGGGPVRLWRFDLRTGSCARREPGAEVWREATARGAYVFGVVTGPCGASEAVPRAAGHG